MVEHMDKLYIVIPAYNESETIEEVVNDWYPVVEKIGTESKLVIIDDGSKDNTYEKMKKLAETRPQFEPITKLNSGHGATVLYGYHYALEHGADFVFQTDSDGQTLSSEFWPFWEMRHDYKMIIGHRNKREDGFSRVFVTKTLKFVIKLCFGVTVTDANTPFRLMEATCLRQHLSLVPENFNLSNVIISVIYAKKNVPTKYIPITFRPRQGGVNSINMKKIFKIGEQALKDFKEINRAIR